MPPDFDMRSEVGGDTCFTTLVAIALSWFFLHMIATFGPRRRVGKALVTLIVAATVVLWLLLPSKSLKSLAYLLTATTMLGFVFTLVLGMILPETPQKVDDDDA